MIEDILGVLAIIMLWIWAFTAENRYQKITYDFEKRIELLENKNDK